MGAFDELMSCVKRRSNKNLDALADRTQSLVFRAYPGLTQNLCDDYAIKHSIRALAFQDRKVLSFKATHNNQEERLFATIVMSRVFFLGIVISTSKRSESTATKMTIRNNEESPRNNQRNFQPKSQNFLKQNCIVMQTDQPPDAFCRGVQLTSEVSNFLENELHEQNGAEFLYELIKDHCLDLRKSSFSRTKARIADENGRQLKCFGMVTIPISKKGPEKTPICFHITTAQFVYILLFGTNSMFSVRFDVIILPSNIESGVTVEPTVGKVEDGRVIARITNYSALSQRVNEKIYIGMIEKIRRFENGHTPHEILSHQEWVKKTKESELGFLYDFLTTKVLPIEPKSRQELASSLHNFTIINKLLYKCEKDAELRLFVPSSFRETLIRERHSGVCSGHMSGKNVFLQLAEKYFWPNMYSDCVKTSFQCCICAHTRNPRSDEKMHSDIGKEFVNETLNEIAKVLKMEKSLTSGYDPQANGVTERVNQTILSMLKRSTASNWTSDKDFAAPFDFGKPANFPSDVTIIIL
ncbi:hypothetical protein niasHT_020874 [Heterodera trifolii]|uniref:RNA-directed DNA polymerase n=1 Tax=Heterodera trifolii TaxID=157864 RepID=A0ABD2JU66_9BILA